MARRAPSPTPPRQVRECRQQPPTGGGALPLASRPALSQQRRETPHPSETEGEAVGRQETRGFEPHTGGPTDDRFGGQRPFTDVAASDKDAPKNEPARAGMSTCNGRRIFGRVMHSST